MVNNELTVYCRVTIDDLHSIFWSDSRELSGTSCFNFDACLQPCQAFSTSIFVCNAAQSSIDTFCSSTTLSCHKINFDNIDAWCYNFRNCTSSIVDCGKRKQCQGTSVQRHSEQGSFDSFPTFCNIFLLFQALHELKTFCKSLQVETLVTISFSQTF